MGDTKFTPGPWNIKRYTISIHVAPQVGFNVAEIVVPFDKWHTKKGTIKQDANAHLIAAAPEMYEALEEAAGVVNAALPENQRENSPTLVKARAALAKARGESHDQ